MPRVTTVTKAQKDAGNCQACGKPILKGQSYRWFSRKTGPASGYKVRRHADCPPWKGSELTANQYQATYLAAVEAFDAGTYGSADEIADAMRDVAEAARENADTLRENAESIESGFGHSTSMSDELTERADGWEGFADEIESEADNISSEEFDEEDEDADEEAFLDELRSRAEDAVNSSPE